MRGAAGLGRTHAAHRNPGKWDSITQHNPAAQRDPVSGTYLIFYMGSTDNGTVHTGGGKCADDPATQPLCNQRVGLAYAKSPHGYVFDCKPSRYLSRQVWSNACGKACPWVGGLSKRRPFPLTHFCALS
jgi:hypothetical protein